MRFTLATVVLVLAATIGAASAGSAEPTMPAIQITAPNGAVSTMIGTMHVGYPGLRQPDPAIVQRARVLVVEHGLDESPSQDDLAPAPFAELDWSGPLPRAHWAKDIDDRQLERLRTNLQCVTDRQITREHIALLLTTRVPRLLAMFAFVPRNRLPSRDAILLQGAKARGIEVVPLETPQAIADRRRAIPDHIYGQQLRYGLNADLDTLYRQLVRALNSGDYDAIAAIVAATHASATDAATVHRILIRERNAAWMPRLTAELNKGNAVVAIGAAHLPGTDGLLALLTRAGYRVQRTQVPGSAPQ